MLKCSDTGFYKNVNKKLTLVNKHNNVDLFGKIVQKVVKVM